LEEKCYTPSLPHHHHQQQQQQSSIRRSVLRSARHADRANVELMDGSRTDSAEPWSARPLTAITHRLNPNLLPPPVTQLQSLTLYNPYKRRSGARRARTHTRRPHQLTAGRRLMQHLTAIARRPSVNGAI